MTQKEPVNKVWTGLLDERRCDGRKGQQDESKRCPCSYCLVVEEWEEASPEGRVEEDGLQTSGCTIPHL